VHPPHRQHRPLPPPPLRIRGLATFLKKIHAFVRESVDERSD
jgi:hypothetical protein